MYKSIYAMIHLSIVLIQQPSCKNDRLDTLIHPHSGTRLAVKQNEEDPLELIKVSSMYDQVGKDETQNAIDSML